MGRLPLPCRTPVAGWSLSDADAVELEQVLRAIADRQRLRILDMLVHADGAEICVCEFTAGLDVPQQNVSYHLKQLVEAGIIRRARRGRYSFYALVPGALDHVAALVAGPGAGLGRVTPAGGRPLAADLVRSPTEADAA